MKPAFAILTLSLLTACVGAPLPDNPVEPGAAGNASIAETSCRSAAAEQGLRVRNLTAFRQVTGANGPSGLSSVLTVDGGTSGEAKCDFSYTTGRAAITLY
jgi:hypothetical protein